MNMVSCMDCSKEFWNDDYQEHIKCISEEEKYSGKDYKPRPGQNKGEVKQDTWLQQVDTAIKSSSASPRLRQLLERMKDYPNIPRKQAKFLNFIKNSLKIFDPQLGMALWDILMSSMPSKKEEEQPNGKENKDNNSDETEEKVEEEEEEELKATKNKMSKREKKEKRREQNKTEKKDRGKKRKHNSDDDDDDENVDDDEVDKKRKKREENRLSKKKDKKRKREEDSVNNAEQQNGTKKKKSHKKQKDDADDDEEDDDDGLPPLEPNPNHVHEEEEEEENDEDARPPKKKPNKHFNWEQIILTLLKKSKENSMSEKKLRKKVLAEYMSEGYQMDSGVLKAKFDRKIKKNPRFVRHKDQIRLID